MGPQSGQPNQHTPLTTRLDGLVEAISRGLLGKQQAELQAFDEQLNHYANERISLDLDDGVKVNYAKFGTLLADVKKVSGKPASD